MKRPLRIIIIAILLFGLGIWSILECLSSRMEFRPPYFALMIPVAVGLMRGRRWSRTLMLWLIGCGYLFFVLLIGTAINFPENLTMMIGSTAIEGPELARPTLIYSAWGITILAWLNYSLCTKKVKSFFAWNPSPSAPEAGKIPEPEFQI